MELKRVAVTGLGALTPLGNTWQETWKAMQAGESGAAEITRFDASQYKTRFACEVKNYDPLNYFDRKEARKNDFFVHYAMIAADEALNDSGLDLEKIDKNRVGVIWASGVGGLFSFQEEVYKHAKNNGKPRFTPFFITRLIVDLAAGMISIKNGFRGPNYATVSACASSTNALIDGFNAIRYGKANIIVSGGSEAAVTESGMGGFSAMRALSERNDDPKTASRPFCKDRDGFVLGEGGVALILEEMEHAKARGATIYAEVVGGGMAADAYHITSTHPEGLGAVLGMNAALDDAGLHPNDVDYINAHATATPVGDVSEVKAIEKVFAETVDKINVSATKSMTGHLLGAAGAIEGMATVLAIHDNVVPPTINHHTLDPDMETRIDLTLGKKKEKTINVAMSNTFGFGGHNAIAVFKKYDE
ncbi:MAG: beta-ketoacyl-ACP synthase II [Calditrichia bacterium]